MAKTAKQVRNNERQIGYRTPLRINTVLCQGEISNFVNVLYILCWLASQFATQMGSDVWCDQSNHGFTSSSTYSLNEATITVIQWRAGKIRHLCGRQSQLIKMELH